MYTSTPTSSESTLSPEALRSLTVQQDGVHPLLKAVRSTCRSQGRRPQLEDSYVEWIERFVRLFPEEPVGRLALFHAHTFFDRLEEKMDLTAQEREQAREALQFLRTQVLLHSRAGC
jgi:hypothetical protein